MTSIIWSNDSTYAGSVEEVLSENSFSALADSRLDEGYRLNEVQLTLHPQDLNFIIKDFSVENGRIFVTIPLDCLETAGFHVTAAAGYKKLGSTESL